MTGRPGVALVPRTDRSPSRRYERPGAVSRGRPFRLRHSDDPAAVPGVISGAGTVLLPAPASRATSIAPRDVQARGCRMTQSGWRDDET
ncbi:hypothetical protein GCM10012285_52510 [Streptomyces kronopolitis]|uniref:Uncharacterized protein n=1 Tax=Streptomyces kronopolitis TaxID=1612435 RepID=A0ABQ2JVH8_9ACTN|nr:hypothetical protein GCM10012285_52510 [Streptomyces kronopolitis]